jgi:hypothetical protein
MSEKQHGASATTGPTGGGAGQGPGGAQAAPGQGFNPAPGQGFAPGAPGMSGGEAGPRMSPGMGAAHMGAYGPDPAYGIHGTGAAQLPPQHPPRGSGRTPSLRATPQAAITAAVKAWTLVQGGLEEVKERFQDAEAELRAAKAAQGE